MFSVFVLSILFAASIEAAIGPNAELVVSNAQRAPDGFKRDTIVVNGQFPSPLITGTKGDHFNLNVLNLLQDTDLDTVTSVHWHGLFQRGSAHADGPAFVAQCPIVPFESFNYQFSVPDQAGTYWYHSHYKLQYCQGLRGPIVIYDPEDPQKHLYNVDNEGTVITLADWYHTTKFAPGPQKPDSTLINGKGRYSGDLSAPLSVVNVEQGLRYRFRLISISCDANFVFSIDGHSFSVIEVDGTSHQPLPIDSVQIMAGQRYSLVMAADQAPSNYWIRAQPNSGNASFAGGLNSAILRYAGAPLVDPTSTPSALTQPLVEQNLHPLTDAAAPGAPYPGGADLTIELDVGFAAGAFEINGTSFQSPTVPVLLQVLNGANASSLLPSGLVYELPKNKVIELVIPGGAVGGPHPVHLHGHVFSVVRSAGNSTYNYVNPPKRDVVSIGTSASDRTTIRFTTDNPGPWFFHCHIDFHLNEGFAAVFVEDQADIKAVDKPTKNWDLLCPAYNIYAKLNNLTVS
ncbi:multicopper oxidase [Peniophora sp. CONT]|nr:multicopper oxidase [Peniophora sp. CONT]